MAATTVTIHANLSVPLPGLSYLSKIEDSKPLITLHLQGQTDEDQRKLLENKFAHYTLFPLGLFSTRKNGDEIVLHFKEKNVQIIAKCQQPQGKFELERDKVIDNSLNTGIRIANNKPQTFEDIIFITMMKTRGFSEVKLEDVKKTKETPKTLKTINVKLIQKQRYNFDWIEYDTLPAKKDIGSKKSEQQFSKETQKMFKGMFVKKA